MIAGPRDERLNVLAELVKWAERERLAADAGDHALADLARARMKEAVALLGFDPIEYDAGRDWAAVVVSRRIKKMLDAMPGTTTELACAAGVASRQVHTYLSPLLNRGEIRCTKRRTNSYWEVVA
jgi:hypothetical protein